VKPIPDILKSLLVIFSVLRERLLNKAVFEMDEAKTIKGKSDGITFSPHKIRPLSTPSPIFSGLKI
jgi:hypothetical protein